MNAYQIWKRIDELRGSESLSDIAVACGIKYQRMKEQRSSNRIPGVEDLFAMALHLGTSVDFIISGVNAQEHFTSRVSAIARACERTTEKNLRLIESILDLDIEGKNNPIPTAG